MVRAISNGIRFVEPMYARLVQKLPEGEDWLYEVKFDGYRLPRCPRFKRSDAVVATRKLLHRPIPTHCEGVRAIATRHAVGRRDYRAGQEWAYFLQPFAASSLPCTSSAVLCVRRDCPPWSKPHQRAAQKLTAITE